MCRTGAAGTSRQQASGGPAPERAAPPCCDRTPGVDFEEEGSGLGERRVRISFPGTTEHVREAMRRLAAWWGSEQGHRWRGV